MRRARHFAMNPLHLGQSREFGGHGIRGRCHSRNVHRAMLAALVFSLLGEQPACALSPESPEVRAAVERGVKFLETQKGGSLGVQALVGLTLAKSGARPDHPQIKDAVALVEQELKSGAENFKHDIYSTGVSIMFLVAVNPKKHRYDIETLVRSLHLRQKADGAWGYPLDSAQGKTCDTSMTQFAVLGLWEATDQAEIETPSDVWERVAMWLLRTQDPSGGFGYQGIVSDDPSKRVKQSGALHSMTVAGVCSVYICRDRLGQAVLRNRTDDDLPPALVRVDDGAKKSTAKTDVDARLLAKARSDGNHWISDKFTIDKPTGWLHYYLYALERYETFRQMEGKRPGGNQWYDRGARFLIDSQASNGSWESQAKNPPDTCFALLFLLRSTKKSLDRTAARYREGILTGSGGTPAARQLRLRDALDAAPEAQLLKELIEDLGADDALRTAAVLALADLEVPLDRATFKRIGHTLTQLAEGRDSDARLAAVRVLARSHNLDFAPLLIRRLEDADIEIVLAAREGLVAMSRRADGFGFDARGAEGQRQEAIRAWKAWYKSVRPAAAVD